MTSEPTGSVMCPKCGGEPVALSASVGETLIGYGRGACGRVHDDNCRHHTLYCAQGHSYGVSPVRSCECGWRGKTSCFCCPNGKVATMPDVPVRT